MADQTSSSCTIVAEPAQIMAVIGDFDSYPDWAGAVKEAEVLERNDCGSASEVRFVLNAGPLKDEYTLAYDWDGDRAVRWSLVEAKMLNAMDGSYTLTPRGRGRTEVAYRLSVDIAMPMIGLLRRKAEKTIIDTALKELKKRVEQ